MSEKTTKSDSSKSTSNTLTSDQTSVPVAAAGPSSSANASVKPSGLALLRVPFPEHQISKLPKPFKRDAVKGRCLPKPKGDAPSSQDHFCGGWHGLPAMHLDYVGHAAATDRLLDADPQWSWEPMALDEQGLPRLDEDGGLWIRLTVCGVTRLGYGDAQGKTGCDAMKERIGDAIRNGLMRFGGALGLWHKGELHVEEEQPAPKADDPAQALLLANVKPTTAPDDWKEEEFEKVRLAVELIATAIEKGLHRDAWVAYTGYKTDERVAIYKGLDKAQRKAIRDVQTQVDIEALKLIPMGPTVADVKERIAAGDLDLAADLQRDIVDEKERAAAEELILEAGRQKTRSMA